MIRSIWVVLAGAGLTLWYSLRVVVPCRLRRDGIPALCERLARRWGRLIIRLSGSRVVVEGVEGMDWSRPLVVVANHQSWFDVFALVGYLPVKARFVAKEELSRIPFFGQAWVGCGHISVNRDDRGQAIQSLESAGERVRTEGLAMILFPEGTRSPDGRLQPFKKGAFVLAIQTGVPILPVGISGSREIMPKGSYRIRGGEIRIRVGEPISVEGRGMRDRDTLLEEGRRAILALMEDGDGGSGMDLPSETIHETRGEGA